MTRAPASRPGPQSSPAPHRLRHHDDASPTTQSPPAHSPLRNRHLKDQRSGRRGAAGVACFVVTALVLSAYAAGANLLSPVGRGQLASHRPPPPESPTLAAQSRPPSFKCRAETSPPGSTTATPPASTSAGHFSGPPHATARRLRSAPIDPLAQTSLAISRIWSDHRPSRRPAAKASDNSKASVSSASQKDETRGRKGSSRPRPRRPPPPRRPVRPCAVPERRISPLQRERRPRYYTEGVDLRTIVSVGASIIETLVLQHALHDT